MSLVRGPSHTKHGPGGGGTAEVDIWGKGLTLGKDYMIVWFTGAFSDCIKNLHNYKLAVLN